MYIGKSRIVSTSVSDAYFNQQIKDTIRLSKIFVIAGLIETAFFMFQDLYVPTLLITRLISIGILISYGFYFLFINEKKNLTVERFHTLILVGYVVSSAIRILYIYMTQDFYHPQTQLAIEAYIVNIFLVFLFSGVSTKWLPVICGIPYFSLVGLTILLSPLTFSELVLAYTSTTFATLLVILLAYKKESDTFGTFITTLKLKDELVDNTQISEALKLSLEQNKKRSENLEYLAMTDILTGTYPRSAGLEIVEKEIKHCKRLGTNLALIFIDVDGLKSMNDTHGHAQGDKFLQIIIEHFKERIRTTDHIVRMGGDEFLIALPECDIANASTLIEQVKLSLEDCLIMAVKPTFSYGITRFDPMQNITLNELIIEADQRMYQDKSTKVSLDGS